MPEQEGARRHTDRAAGEERQDGARPDDAAKPNQTQSIWLSRLQTGMTCAVSTGSWPNGETMEPLIAEKAKPWRPEISAATQTAALVSRAIVGTGRSTRMAPSAEAARHERMPPRRDLKARRSSRAGEAQLQER